MARNRRYVLGFTVLLLASVAHALGVRALALDCPGIPIEVSGSSDVEGRAVCASAKRANAFFEYCGLPQKRKLRVEILSEVIQPFGLPVIALFDAKRWRIQISTFEAMRTILLPGSAYRRLPLRDVYDSLVVHEVAHAVFREHIGHRNLPIAAHEYVAYAVQINSMPTKTRDLFLSTFQRPTSLDVEMFNDIYLAMAPLRFGANAHRHLFRHGQSCEMLSKIVAGRVVFSQELE
ncbi:conserved exported protein of unknown function [Candidatus Filomicrobium marinum]|uniref:Metalloprotease n=2 Tax=Filomicrobium TaxID=119044 RepID=A0A0D6JI73_9HYPH|nr:MULTISPECIES: DUF6639 family protein [Filomicrobium]MCV0371542.1 hypothetical protein [Filomicrobium sp.]CFX37522.1 conserved exported protein of unknown function [Candidatus Filomicrobium marinum]CPR21615.1 conserved exported protein of unknown function [Candidatus Filomicrobium marinum]SDP62212.1 hypothetical protein SAMN04488061_3508 [Filomicrobium insigne]